MAEEIENGEIDKEVQEEIMKRQVELGISDEKQMRRTELNFYCEFLSTLQKLNKELDDLHNTINIVSEDKLMAYFKQLDENYKREETRAKVVKNAKRSHLCKDKRVKK